MAQLSSVELRTLVASQIAASLVTSQNIDDEAIKRIAELAVKIAKAVEEAASRTLKA